MAQYVKEPTYQRARQQFKFEALELTLTMHTDSDWAGSKPIEKNVRRSCVDDRWSHQTLELDEATRGTLVRSCAARQEQGSGRSNGSSKLGTILGNHVGRRDQNRFECNIGSGKPRRSRRTATQTHAGLWLQSAIRNEEVSAYARTTLQISSLRT